MSKYSELGSNFITDQFDYDKDSQKMHGELSDLRLNSFPRMLVVVSTKTHKKVTFLANIKKAKENEFWDGLMMYYLPVGDTTNVNVKELVLFND
jgi:hypothetical protein